MARRNQNTWTRSCLTLTHLRDLNCWSSFRELHFLRENYWSTDVCWNYTEKLQGQCKWSSIQRTMGLSSFDSCICPLRHHFPRKLLIQSKHLKFLLSFLIDICGRDEWGQKTIPRILGQFSPSPVLCRFVRRRPKLIKILAFVYFS